MSDTGESQVLKRVFVQGAELDVVLAGGQLALRATDGEEVPLDIDEANLIVGHGPHFVQDRLSLLGAEMDALHADWAKTAAANRVDLDAQIQRSGLSVLLDTSTLNGAAQCIELGGPTPLTLLDLSTLTFALCCFDQIVVQPGSWIAIPPHLSDAVTTLEYPGQFIRSTLWSMCSELMNQTHSPGQMKVWQDAWGSFLGVASPRLDLQMVSNHQDSPLYWNGVLAHAYTDALARDPTRVTSDAGANEYLSIQTMRTLFNDSLAGYLSLSYLPSSIRAPIHAVVLGAKVERQLVVDSLIERIGPRTVSANTSRSPYTGEFSAPFMLGLVLGRMESPGDFWRAVSDMREEFAPLRRRIAEDRDAWDGRRTQYVEDLMAPLVKVSEAADLTVEATAATAATVASAAGAGPLGLLAVKLARFGLPAPVRRQYYKRFRPELHLFFSMASEAKSLRAVDTQLEEVFSMRLGKGDLDALEHYASLQPPAFAQLRDLGPQSRQT